MFLTVIIWLILLCLIFCAFWFSKTTRDIPKSWYEWKMEFRFQYVGIVGLIDDFIYRCNNKVELYKQPDRIAVLTGGNRGIGLRIVEKLLNCDMTVIMGVRDPKTAEQAVKSLINLENIGGKLICEQLDVGNMKSVKEFAGKIKAKYSKVDLLINNAGIMFAPYKQTEDEFESHLAVNYLGHFLLQHLLLPELMKAGKKERKARIVNISSCAHLIGRINYEDINAKKYYYPATAYSQSKLAQILSTRHLQGLLNAQEAPVLVLAVHPGIVDTDLFEFTATTSVPFIKKLIFKTPEEGARTPIYAAISPKLEDGEGGLYLSNCRKATINPIVLNPEKCEKFFKFSCDLLGIEEFIGRK
ncbi:dehydrogenase/reductase SDR family member on chromosome X [Glossina fuscipes]|uniref:Dehydrogenase/reductase SDR family member on chromosome X n=1 Tax=Glossina fuscipes TaxID=7396 RepID=A0A9C5YY58_9MUSC|nr:dehydrogenase/reductase SDR family member on chromosome X [Glossina fuscipes]XP_037888083.1 dehydrogenase/reductase SDR family member on chromosome X [Glossina fuscipes]